MKERIMKFVFISHGIPKLAVKKLTEMTGKTARDIRVLYITTPANTYPPNSDWLVESKENILNEGFQITELDIEKERKERINKLISQHDVVWISGGNTFYFLYWAEKVGLKEMLKKFLEKGGIYAGESAGVMCQIKDLEPVKWVDYPDKAPRLVKQGMQLTDLVVIPHWENIKYLEVMNKIKRYYEDRSIKPYLLRNGEAIIVDGKQITFY